MEANSSSFPLHFSEFLAKKSKARKHEHLHCTRLTLVPMKDHRLWLPAGVTLALSGLQPSPGSGPPAALRSLPTPPLQGEVEKSNFQGCLNPASSHNNPLHPLLRPDTAVSCLPFAEAKSSGNSRAHGLHHWFIWVSF